MVVLNHIRNPVTHLLKNKWILSTQLSALGGAASLWSEAAKNKGGKKELAAFKDPIRQVFISQSTDVFSNLALEDWIYRNHDFDHKHLLLLWRNDPTVVIGRHQNPWTETNLPFLRQESINLARRNSGGGTVYHDLGNINCTFFTRRAEYNRRKNLDIICSAIKRISELNVSVNKRDDIVVDDTLKVSGTAAKLGPNNAYHHCTVLVDVNECVLHDALNSQATDIETRATQSVRVPVRNLRRADPSLNVDLLQESLGWEFLRTNMDGVDCGLKAAYNQRGFQLIRPEEDWFPGLEKIREDFQSHTWIFGKTPNFKVSRLFPLPDNMQIGISASSPPELKIQLDVNHGVIQDVRVQLPYGLLDPDLDLSTVMHGLSFGQNLPEAVEQILSSEKIPQEKRDFLSSCIKNMVSDFV